MRLRCLSDRDNRLLRFGDEHHSQQFRAKQELLRLFTNGPLTHSINDYRWQGTTVCFETLVIGQSFEMHTWNKPALQDDPREVLYHAFRTFVLHSAEIYHRHTPPSGAASATVVWFSRPEWTRQIITKSVLIQFVRSSGAVVLDVNYVDFHAVDMLAIVHQADVVVTAYGSATAWGYFQRPGSVQLVICPNWETTVASEFRQNVATYIPHGCALAGVFVTFHAVMDNLGSKQGQDAKPYHISVDEFRPVWQLVISTVIDAPITTPNQRVTLIENGSTFNV